MLQVDLYNQSGEVVGKTDLPEEVFGLANNPELLVQVLQGQLANRRQVLAHTKDRSEVRGGGVKPWRQKGTGRARHGSIRSPIWKGGGVTFGPTKERNFSKKVNIKAKRKALLISLSDKVRTGQLLVVQDFSLDVPKTKTIAGMFSNLSKNLTTTTKRSGSTLLVLPKNTTAIEKSTRNLPRAKAVAAAHLNLADVLQYRFLFLTEPAIAVIKETFVK